jgi:hypothetical protein
LKRNKFEDKQQASTPVAAFDPKRPAQAASRQDL